MKKLALIPIIVLFFVTFSLPALGKMPAHVLTQMSIKDREVRISSEGAGHVNLTDRKPTILESRIDNLKQRALSEIDRRITSLTNVEDRISKIKKLTDAQKTQLQNNIQAEITQLDTLKTKIQSDTDLQTLRDDTKSIITSYRIYLLYLPVTRIIIAADGLLDTADKLSSVAASLQTKINEAKGQGQDTANLEKLLTDIQTQITGAKTQANNAISAVTTLNPTAYHGNKQFLQTARKMLQTALKDLLTAKQDARKIIESLRKLGKHTDITPSVSVEPTSTPTETPTPTLTPTPTI